MAVKFVLSVAFLRAARETERRRERKKRKVHFNNTPQNGRLRVVFFTSYPVDADRLVSKGCMQVEKKLQLIESIYVP